MRVLTRGKRPMLARNVWLFCLWLLLCTLPLCAVAQPAEKRPEIPEELEPWIPWVLAQVPDRECRKVADVVQCAWPGRLELEVSDRGGRFSLEVVLDAESDVI